MIVDANVLLCAHNQASEHHEPARGWLEEALNGRSRVGLPWWSLAAFVRIGTNPRAFARPLSAESAADQVEQWLAAPRAWIPEPSTNFGNVFLRLVRRHRITGALVTDAQLAALAIDHGVPVVSADSDFARFDEIRWINPLDSGEPIH